MGKVVDIESKPRRKSRRRKKPSKTALVLGGGGFTGGVYEIGALRALDLLAVNSTVNNFDVYVGTSAGSFVAAMLANGVTPDEMMQVINTRVPSELEDLELGKMLSPNYMGFAEERRCGCPSAASRRCGRCCGSSDLSAIDLGVALRRTCRPASTTAAGSATTSAEVLTDGGRSNDFRVIDPELYLTATDLDTCERIVFGEEGWRDVPISKAVECSTALPIVYKPVELKGRQLVDGGIRSTTNVDIAVEAGAKFIVVVNPLVPYINDFEKTIPTMFGSRVRRVSDMGLPAIGNQTFRLIAHARLHQAVEQWQETLPGRRHPAARAGGDRRADVRHADHGLRPPPRHRPPRLRIGHRDARPGLRALRRGRRQTRPRDLRAPPPPRGRAGRGGQSPSRPPPGAGCSSRRPRSCSASPARPPSAAVRGLRTAGRYAA